MQPKENTPVSGKRSLIWAEQSLTWTTCLGAVATGRTTEQFTPARAIEAASPALVPSEKERVWDACSSLGMVVAASRSGKVWVWMSMTMGIRPFLSLVKWVRKDRNRAV